MKVSVVWGKVTLQANSDNHFAKIKVGFLFEMFEKSYFHNVLPGKSCYIFSTMQM